MPKGPWPKDPKLKGSAAEGIRFQKKVHDNVSGFGNLGRLYYEPWFRYSDTYGTHWCSPDSLLEYWDRVLVVESKLSLRRLETAITQLTKCYRPVVEHVFEKPVVMIVAFKHWFVGADIETLECPTEILSIPLSKTKQPYGWHVLH